MATNTIQCVKCGSAMESGYIPDRNMSWYDPRKWFPGALRLTTLQGVAKNKSTPRHVISYRCTACGYIESYAPNEEDKTV